MKFAEVVEFRKDLLFNGAVQMGWFETDPQMAMKAAKHYVFHGPDYHGVTEEDLGKTISIKRKAPLWAYITKRFPNNMNPISSRRKAETNAMYAGRD